MLVQRRLTASTDSIPWSLGSSAVTSGLTNDNLAHEATALSDDASFLDRAFAQLFDQLEALRASEEAVPEVFDLQPLSRRRVTAHVIRRSRAQFHFIDGDRELLIDD